MLIHYGTHAMLDLEASAKVEDELIQDIKNALDAGIIKLQFGYNTLTNSFLPQFYDTITPHNILKSIVFRNMYWDESVTKKEHFQYILKFFDTSMFPQLISLDLSHNRFSDEEIVEIETCLGKNNILLQLNLIGNFICHEKLNRIEEHLYKNKIEHVIASEKLAQQEKEKILRNEEEKLKKFQEESRKLQVEAVEDLAATELKRLEYNWNAEEKVRENEFLNNVEKFMQDIAAEREATELAKAATLKKKKGGKKKVVKKK